MKIRTPTVEGAENPSLSNANATKGRGFFCCRRTEPASGTGGRAGVAPQSVSYKQWWTYSILSSAASLVPFKLVNPFIIEVLGEQVLEFLKGNFSLGHHFITSRGYDSPESMKNILMLATVVSVFLSMQILFYAAKLVICTLGLVKSLISCVHYSVVKLVECCKSKTPKESTEPIEEKKEGNRGEKRGKNRTAKERIGRKGKARKRKS